MTKTDPHVARRLQRLEKLLAGRRARLATAVDRQRMRLAVVPPTGMLERYGYRVALLLASTAMMPSVIGFALRRRRMLSGAVLNALAIWSLTRRLGSAQRAGRGR